MFAITKNKPLQFGPYNAAFLVAHKIGNPACSLIAGAVSDIEGAKIDLSDYSVFTMPAGASCIVRHQHRGKRSCKLRIDQVSRMTDSAEACEGKSQPSTLDPPPPPPQQICLCPDGEYKCNPGDDPDCGAAGVCEPAAFVDLSPPAS